MFIHVMKTGGTTLVQHLREHVPPDELYPHPELDMSLDPTKRITLRHLTLSYLRALPEDRRRRLRVYSGHFPYVASEVVGDDVVTLTLLREPVARTVSLLRQWSRNRPEQDLSLEDVYDLPLVYDRLVHDHQTKIFSMTVDDDPRGYMQVDEVDRDRLDRAKANLEKVDLVGLTEGYDDFLDLVTERFGWQIRRGVRWNAAAPEGEREPSEALLARIAEDNALDAELYAHARALVEARGAAAARLKPR
jgi:hypothetical protein